MPDTPIPQDHPLMQAWNAHKASPEYANSRNWAKHDEHVDGSLWALFMAGWMAAKAPATPAQPAMPEPVAFGWAIVDKNGREVRTRARITDLFGSAYEAEPLGAEDLAREDREHPGIAPHRLLTLYTAEASAALAAQQCAQLRDRLAYAESLAGYWKGFSDQTRAIADKSKARCAQLQAELARVNEEADLLTYNCAALREALEAARKLVLDYAIACGELSKGLPEDAPMWAELKALGERIPALAADKGDSPAPSAQRPAFVAALRGLVDSLHREPTEFELRAAAHELTVKADRIAASQRQAGGTIGPEDC